MDAAIENLKAQARQHAIPEADVLKAWQEMRIKHRLPWYVQPTLETGLLDGTIRLSPAVNINLLSRVLREVPGFESITGPVWPGKGVPENRAELMPLLAKTEGNPVGFCCRQCSECAPKELPRQGQMTWLRTHYQAKHPGIWGEVRLRR